MEMKFTKMHGCGNDYIFFNCINKEIENPSELSKKLSDRHFGIGGDGIVLICSSKVADAKMRMFNCDGSEGKMFGNAIRCVGKYLSDNNIVNSICITIETLSGIKKLELIKENDKVIAVKVDMGAAILEPEKIPVIIKDKNDMQPVIAYPILVDNKEYRMTCISMGNPHCVLFCDDIDSLELSKIGPLFENNEIFPDKVNTEFVKVINKETLKMRVWERGSGETLACGTGASAAVVAAVLNQFCEKGKDITVQLVGGNLTICYTNNTVYMTGNCIVSFEGIVTL